VPQSQLLRGGAASNYGARLSAPGYPRISASLRLKRFIGDHELLGEHTRVGRLYGADLK
jgi:hypothetical protein